jgi:hypothetical protein
MICYDCGTQLKTRHCGRGLEVYDSEEEMWLRECPACEGDDFYREGEEYILYT